MTATVTNQNKNTGSMTNQNLSSNSLILDEATFTWNEASGTWDNPYVITNQSKNTGTISNQSIT